MPRVRPLLATSLVLLALASAGWLLWPRAATSTEAAPRAPDAADDVVPPAPREAPFVQGAPARRRMYLEVLSADHAPVAGARVRAVAPFGTQEALTDAQGLALLEGVPGVLARLEAEATGYARQVFVAPKLPSDDEVSWTFTLAVADESADRMRGATLAEGAPLPGALVLLVPARDDGAGLRPEHLAVTDETGRFVSDVPRAEIGRVIALHRDHGVVELARGEAGEIALELPPGGFLEGRVVSGASVSGASVSGAVPVTRFDLRVDVESQLGALRQAMSAFWRLSPARRRAPDVREKRLALDRLRRPRVEQVAGDDGRFRIGPVPPGAATVFARAPESQPASLAVQVPSAATLDGLLLRLEEPLSVRGRVTDAVTGAPIGGARVRVSGAAGVDMPGFGEAITDEEGRYRLATSSAERHSLSVRARAYQRFDVGGLEGRAGDALVRDVALQPATGDPHVREYVGVGATLRPHEDGASVVSVFDDGPAAGKLQPGDVILRVDGVWVEGRPLREIVQRIVGEPGTEVELLVRPRGQSHTERVPLRRARLSTAG